MTMEGKRTNKTYKNSLAKRVFTICFLLFALPLLVYFFIHSQNSYRDKLKDTVLRLKELGQSRAQILSDLTVYNSRTLNIIEEFFHFEEASDHFNADSIHKALKDIVKVGQFDFISYYSITNNGRYICTLSSDLAKIGKDYTNYHYVQNTIITNELSFLAFGTTSLQRRFYVTKTILSPKTKKRVGILTLATSVEKLLKNLISTQHSPYPIHFSLLTEDFVVFISSHPDFALRSLTPLSKKVLKRIKKKKQFGSASIRESNFTQIPIPGIKNAIELVQNETSYIAFFLPIKNTNLTLLLHANKEDVFQSEQESLQRFIIIFFIIFTIGLSLTLWLTQRMSQPLESLCRAMEKVSHGNFQTRYKKDRMGFEINILGDIFNNTLAHLLSHMKKAENERVQKETLKKEFKIGYDIQTTILPKEMPAFPGIEIAARYSPAKEVGGDFYDIFIKNTSSGKQQLMVSIADAAGKGISACLYSLLVRSMLRSYYLEHEDLATTLKRTNFLFCEDTQDTGMFVTVLATIYNPEDKSLTYCSCGHNPGIVIRNDGSIEPLENKGCAMGVIDFENISSKTKYLSSGDLVVLYTDGITEAFNTQGESFEKERLIDSILELRPHNVDTIANGILQEVNSFAKNTTQHDDMTLIVMRIL
jgi:phosphoserine phosphatase RsbU/P